MFSQLNIKPFSFKKRGYASSTKWDEHRQFIEERLEKSSHQAIIDALKNERGVTIKMHQLKRCLGVWGLSKQNLMLKQRHFIWTIFQKNKSVGKPDPRPTFFFKKDNRAVPENQIDEVLKGDGSEFLNYQNNDVKSPGLSYSMPPVLDDSPASDNHDPVDENDNSHTDAMASPAANETANSNTNDPNELSLERDISTSSANEHGSEYVYESHESAESAKLADNTEENSEAVQTMCEEILNSVDRVHTAISGEPETTQSQSRDYSAEFSVKLEERIAHEKRIASLFLQEMDEEKARSEGTGNLSLSECYSRVRARWYHRYQIRHMTEEGSLPNDWDPLPYSLYQQLHQLDPRKQVRDPDPRHYAFIEDICTFYKQHIDEGARFSLSYPASHITNAGFQYQGAHFLTLAKRFGPTHYFTVKAFTKFVTIQGSLTTNRLPIRILYKILHLLRRLGMQAHRVTIDIIRSIYNTVIQNLNEDGYKEFLKDLIPLCSLWYKIQELRVRQGETNMPAIYAKNALIYRLGTAYLLNQENEKGMSIIRHARSKMLRVCKPVAVRDFWEYGSAWYSMGAASMRAGIPLEAKSNFQSAFESLQRIMAKHTVYREYAFNCLTWMGEACSKLGEYKLAIENEKAYMDFRKEYFGVKDQWYLNSIHNATDYMERRGLVRYSQPILHLTIETCEAMGIDEESYRKLVNQYYGRSYLLDKCGFDASAYGFQSWSGEMQLD